MFEITVFTVFLVTFVFCGLVRLWGSHKRRPAPPGPLGFPIVGHLPLMGKSPIKVFAKWRKQYGDVYRIRMGSWDTVIVNGYEAVKEAAEAHDDAFSSRPNFTTQRLLEECNGDGSLPFGPFDEAYLFHRKVTATVLRSFTSKISNYTEELVSEEADKLTAKLLVKATGGAVDIRNDIQYSVGSVIYQLLYGRGEDVSYDLNNMIQGAIAFTKFTQNGNPLDVMPWLERFMPKNVTTFKKLLTDANRIARAKIQEHVEVFSKEEHQRNVIDEYLKHTENMDNQSAPVTRSRLLGTINDLQGAGFDTTNKTLQFMILHMCKYPEVQAKVQKEIDDVIGGRSRVMLNDRKYLVYTEATILESMRMSVIAPFGLPRFTTKETSLQGYGIDKDTVVFFNLHSASYDKELWGNPEEFRPERYIDENNELDQNKCCRVISFSLGRRRCVGEHLAKMQMFIMFANMMQKCSFVKPEAEMLELEAVPGLVYSPKPFKVIVKERE